MERLSDYTRKLHRDAAFDALRRHHFDAKEPKRFISGIAVSTNQEVKSYSLEAFGVRVELPALLLLGHETTYPLGLVRSVDVRGTEVHFKAEIANARGASWVDQSWWQIVNKEMTGVSVYSRNLDPPMRHRKTWTRWAMDEISLAPQGADPGARILRAWERPSTLYVDGRPNEIVFWSET